MSDVKSVVFSIQGDATDPLDFCLSANGKFAKEGSALGIDAQGMSVYSFDKGFTAKELLEARTYFPGETVTFWLASSKQDIADNDIQPYIILKDQEDKPVLAVFLEGDFPSYMKTDSSFSPEYHAVEDYLKTVVDECLATHPDIEDMDEMLSAIIADLAQKKEEIETSLFGGKRGLMAVVAANGERCLFTNGIKENTDWGWTSDHCKPTVAVDKKPLFSRRPTPAATPSNNVSADKSTNVAELVWVKPGAKTQVNQAIKQVWSQILERKWEDLIKDKAFNEKSLLNKEPVQIPKSRIDALKAQKVDFLEVVKVDPVSGSQTVKRPEGGSAVAIPVLNTKSKDVTIKLFKEGALKGILDGTSEKILSQDQVKLLTEKHRDWYQQMEDVDKAFAPLRERIPFCDYSVYADIAWTDANSMAQLAWSLGCEVALHRTVSAKIISDVDKFLELEAEPKVEVKKPMLIIKRA
jgi:hypothetical protein